MKKIFAIFFILLIMTTASHGQKLQEPLQLTITSDKQLYGVGEEIMLVVMIRNTSDRSVSIMNMDFSSFGQSSGLKFNIQDPRNEHPPYIHIEQVSDIGYSPNILILSQNEILESSIKLTRWYKFDQPGLYTIKAEFVRNMKEEAARYKDHRKCYRSRFIYL